MEYFVEKGSIVRKIWGNGDTILMIFAGASAEFALNKAVDWLYFTGRLPADPLGRLFSTVSYARRIVFSERTAAHRTIEAMANIHAAVEEKRGASIPDWAYRDVLFMLIDYSIRSFEVLEHKLSRVEKQEVFQVFREVGSLMGLKGLPDTFEVWKKMREEHLSQNLENSGLTEHLFRQYRKHLGPVRYRILIEAQTLLVPATVKDLLALRSFSLISPLIGFYKISRGFNLDGILKTLILPGEYLKEIKDLDRATV
ncbi:DUF2236 domain-containing protein [Antarcticibacterium arcticum]|uniref:DUF2236 domain-containing protein n=1 Tax=Antarcticibacterium arcticum TaxID=2585771 RepID=A0A5B8YN47_9FLAO|nr:oxygenase MpaB family protein [Antarcticibacterium arcticum]QED38043.1 DUF2236 domain-containing protein [Antarcticibacterium arcticum]